MAKTKATKGGKAKSPKKAVPQKDGPLAKSFQTRVQGKSPPPAAAAAATTKQGEQPKKLQTSGFLSYLATTSKSSNSQLSNMACLLSEKYRQLDGMGKKQLVAEFFRSGGKKQGLLASYAQIYKTSQTSSNKGWAGYVTCGMLMEMFGVSPGQAI